MKRNIFVYSALSMALFATFSCSDETIPADWNNGNKETINFAPMLDNGGVVTRAHSEEALNKGYTVWLENNGNGNLKKSSVATYNDTESKYSFDPALYWDDISADNASSSSTKTDVRDGATVKVWAANFAGKETSNYTVSDDHKITWNIDAAQATNGYEKNDLLVADYIAEQKAIDGTTKQTIPLCFHHAMTKITINVIQGDGFTASPTNEISGSTTTVTLKAQNTKATIDLSKAKGDKKDEGMVDVSTTTSDIKDITMRAATSGYSYKTGSGTDTKTAAASFDAIVVEGKELKSSTTPTNFAEIKIKSATNNSAYNTYKVPINDAILKAWNGGTDPTGSKLSLKHGVHYILNVTVKKQGIELTAVLAPWTELTAETAGIISFTATNTMISDATAKEFTLPFTVYSKTTAKDATYQEGSSFQHKETKDKVGYYDYVTGENIMYWADDKDARYFRAALYESAEVKTETKGDVSTTTVTGQAYVKNGVVQTSESDKLKAVEYSKGADLIWGTSGNSTSDVAVNPTTSAVNMLFQHALAQVTIKLKTTPNDSKGNAAPDAIDLTKVKTVEITGTKTSGGTLSLHDGTISIAEGTDASNLALSNNSTTENAKYETSKTYLVLPQTFSTTTGAEPKIKITMEDGTTFSVNLNTIHKETTENKGMGQTTAAWLQGENYVYTITITKQKIEFTAVVKDWETKTGSGNATMDWD